MRKRSIHRVFSWLPVLFAVVFPAAPCRAVVINEIFYHPPEECLKADFIELHNPSGDTVFVGGWRFSRGLEYMIPSGTGIGPGGYLVIAQDPETFARVFPGAPGPVLGPFDAELDNGGERIRLEDESGRIVDEVRYRDEPPWPLYADGFGSSLELIHPSLDNEEAGYWRASGPHDEINLQPLSAFGEAVTATPGRINSAYGENPPPVIREVRHEPRQPKPGEEIIVTARVADTEGIRGVDVLRQDVAPGRYIPRDSDSFLRNWSEIEMLDDGQWPDRAAGDGEYAAALTPAGHRDLIRYRVRAQNRQAIIAVSPHASDTSPNHACFVYGGVPPYRVTEPVERVHTVLDKVPVYHLIAYQRDIYECEHVKITDNAERREFKWRGTFVYNGDVYDHIRYRLRGGVWRYSFNKRMWKIRFNNGHYFRGHFNDGTPHPRPRRTLNLNAITQNMRVNNPRRGELGLFESLGFWLFKKAGVASWETAWAHFRIVQSPDEEGPDQFSGDFRGLYLDVEQPDERSLENQGYHPDTHLYKMNRNWTVDGKVWEKETNSCDPADDSDIERFYNAYNSVGIRYLERNLDIDKYLSYRCILEAIHHYDVYAEKNYYYLHNADTGLWEVAPWDLDLTFGADHGTGREPFRDMVVGDLSSRTPREGPYAVQYKNRLREILQLLYNEDILFPLLDSWRDLIIEIARADLDRWDRFRPPDAEPEKSRYKPLDVRLEDMKDWIRRRIHETYTDNNNGPPQYVVNLIEMADDPDIPAAPSIEAPGGASAFPPEETVFRSSRFASPAGNAHAASRWIVTREGRLEIEPDWDSGVTAEHLESIPVHLGLFNPGERLRLRVRHLDDSGRWSAWSEPLGIAVAGDAAVGGWEAW